MVSALLPFLAAATLPTPAGALVLPPENAPLDGLIAESLERVAGHITERGVEIEVAPDLPVVHGDRERLLEVFQNLIDNAVKFMGDQSAPRVTVGARRVGDGEVLCHVRDNGIGIDPAHQKRIFGLFDRLDSRTEGTGVGLALVKSIVELHGGRIWVESAGEGQGSTFVFTLPAEKGQAPSLR